MERNGLGAPSSAPVLRRAALFLAITGFLFACLDFDVLHVLDDQHHEAFDTGQNLVLQRLLNTTPDTSPIFPGAAGPQGLYLSQFGLPGIVIAALQPDSMEEREAHLRRASHVVALLTAAVLAAFFVSAGHRFGLAATGLAVLLTGMSPYLLGFGRSTFFAPFLFFLPFVASWLLYPRWVQEGRRPVTFYLLICGLVMIKGLSGYEYITATAAGAAVAVVYHEWTHVEDWRRPLVQAVRTTVAGITGFVLAIGLHVVQLIHLFGAEGQTYLLDRATQRTVGDARTATQLGESLEKIRAAFGPGSPIGWLLDTFGETAAGVLQFARFFLIPAINLPGSDAGRMQRFGPYGPIALFVAIAVIVLLVAWRRGFDLENPTHRLAALTVLSLVAPLSWQTLAWGHMVAHGHLNGIVFFVPTLLLAYVLVGRLAVAAATSRRG